MLQKHFTARIARIIAWPLAILLTAGGIFDQTSKPSESYNNSIHEIYKNDRTFIRLVESNVPKGSAIYQLPYMGFPENGPVNRLEDYGLLIGFLHSNSLRWSHGVAKGSVGDHFFRALSKQPLARQVEVISKLGFAGIYIDRRGFDQELPEMEKELRQLLGSDFKLENSDKKLVFYKVPYPEPITEMGLDPGQIMMKAGFSIDQPHSLSDIPDHAKQND